MHFGGGDVTEEDKQTSVRSCELHLEVSQRQRHLTDASVVRLRVNIRTITVLGLLHEVIEHFVQGADSYLQSGEVRMRTMFEIWFCWNQSWLT